MEYTLLNMTSGVWLPNNIHTRENSFEWFLLEKEKKRCIRKKNNSLMIFFLLKGECEVVFKGVSPALLKEMSFVLLPIEAGLYLRGLEDAYIVTLSLDYFLLSTEILFFKNQLSDKFTPLPIHPVIRQFLLFTLSVLNDGKVNGEWTKLKAKELFFLFQSFYSPEELKQLSNLFSSENIKFRQIIWESLDKVENVPDFLRILGMKRTTFEEKFKNEFGISPYQLLLQYKACCVREALKDSRLSLAEIRRKYGFNSAPHFIRFCRRQFRKTPREMRKKHFSKVVQEPVAL